MYPVVCIKVGINNILWSSQVFIRKCGLLRKNMETCFTLPFIPLLSAHKGIPGAYLPLRGHNVTSSVLLWPRDTMKEHGFTVQELSHNKLQPTKTATTHIRPIFLFCGVSSKIRLDGGIRVGYHLEELRKYHFRQL